MVSKFIIEDTAGPLYFLLDFNWGGQVLHLAEQELDLEIEGETVRYNDGLEWGGNLEQQLEILTSSADILSVDLTLSIQEIIDVADYVTKGHILGSATGKFYVYASATKRRVLLVDGLFKDPSWDEDLPVVGTLEEAPIKDDTGLYPHRNMRITEDSFSATIDTDSTAYGKWYPTIMGQPIVLGLGAATPAYWVGTINPASPTTEYLLIAGHKVEQSDVRVINRNNTSHASNINTIELEDDFGNPITCVSFAYFSALGDTEEDTYRVDWRTLATTTGTLQGITGCGDALEFMLNRSTIRWDRGRIAAIKDKANLFRIDTYISPSPEDAGIVPFEWIQDIILPVLPVSPRIGPNGWYLVWWNFNATKENAILNIEEGRNADRVGAISTTSRDEIVNEVRVTYANDTEANADTYSFTITGDENIAGSTDTDTTIVSYNSRRSLDIYGRSERKTISAGMTTDPTTAAFVANWYIKAHALQRYEVAYTVDAIDAINLTPGDIITVTDSGRGFDERVGFVVSRGWNTDGFITLGLSLSTNTTGEIA